MPKIEVKAIEPIEESNEEIYLKGYIAGLEKAQEILKENQ